MQGLTEEGRRLIDAAAARHGVSAEAAHSLLLALAAGGGTQAQFNHPDLGGMGQWSQGGMIMVGDMFNQQLKARVDALCTELAAALHGASPFTPPAPPRAAQSQSQSSGPGGAGGVSLFVPGAAGPRWPPALGAPSSVGSQNDLHYAVFPETRRLAIDQGGSITVYDTGDHRITGFSQQQGGGQSISFTSQHGLVRLSQLTQIPFGDSPPEAPEVVKSEPGPEATPHAGEASPEVAASPAPSAPMAVPAAVASQPSTSAAGAPGLSADEIFSRIERLAELHKKAILTDAEYAAKKTELLDRL